MSYRNSFLSSSATILTICGPISSSSFHSRHPRRGGTMGRSCSTRGFLASVFSRPHSMHTSGRISTEGANLVLVADGVGGRISAAPGRSRLPGSEWLFARDVVKVVPVGHGLRQLKADLTNVAKLRRPGPADCGPGACVSREGDRRFGVSGREVGRDGPGGQAARDGAGRRGGGRRLALPGTLSELRSHPGLARGPAGDGGFLVSAGRVCSGRGDKTLRHDRPGS